MIMPTIVLSSFFDVKYLLRFAITQVQFAPFNKVTFTPFCDAVQGLEHYDSFLAYGTAYIGYLLILPIIYELARVCCPLDPDPERNDRNRTKSLRISMRKSATPRELSYSETFFTLEGWRNSAIFWSTYLAPDLLLTRITQRLGASLRRKFKIIRANEKNGWFSFCRKENGSVIHNEKTESDTVYEDIHKEVVSKMKEAHSDDHDALPCYWRLLQEEANELLGVSEAEVGMDSTTNWLAITLGLLPVGHLLTNCGWMRFTSVFYRIFVFLLASLGIWNEETTKGYNLVNDFGDFSVLSEADINDIADRNKVNSAYSDALASIVAPRAIILQLLPVIGCFWSSYAINTAGSSIFVFKSSELTAGLCDFATSKLFPLIISPHDAYERAKKEDEKFKDMGFINSISAFRAFFLNSRLIQFLLGVYTVCLPAILLQPDDVFSLNSMIYVLLPLAFINSLGFLVFLGRLLDIKSPRDWGHRRNYWNYRDQVRGKIKTAVEELRKEGKGGPLSSKNLTEDIDTAIQELKMRQDLTSDEEKTIRAVTFYYRIIDNLRAKNKEKIDDETFRDMGISSEKEKKLIQDELKPPAVDTCWARYHKNAHKRQEQGGSECNSAAVGSVFQMINNPLSTVTTARHSASGGGPPVPPQPPVPPVRPQHGDPGVSAVAGDPTPTRVLLNLTQTCSMRLSQTGVGPGPPDLTALSGSRGSGQWSPQSQHHHQHVPDGAVHRTTLMPNYNNRNARSSAIGSAVANAAAGNRASGAGPSVPPSPPH